MIFVIFLVMSYMMFFRAARVTGGGSKLSKGSNRCGLDVIMERQVIGL